MSETNERKSAAQEVPARSANGESPARTAGPKASRAEGARPRPASAAEGARPRPASAAVKRAATAAKPGTAAERPAPASKAKRAAAGRRRAEPGGFDLSGIADSVKGAARSAKDALSGLAKRGDSARPEAKGKKGRRTNILKSKFYRVYFALLTLSIIGIIVGTVWLNGLLKDYESAQPIYVAQEVAKIFEDQDFTALYTMDSSAQDIANGDQAFYEETMRGIVAGREIGWSEAFSANENERKYNVTVGSDRLASFTLVPSGATTAHGNRLWQLGTLDTNVVTETELDETLGERIEYRVTAPEGWTVSVDGAALGADSIVKAGISTLPENFLPSGVTSPVLNQYAFTTRSESPDIQVADASGAVQALREDGERAWICGPTDDPALREKVEAGVVKLAKQMAMFTSKDISRSTLLSNVASDSPAESIIKKFSNYWAPTHKDCEFSNMQVTDCVLHSDSCFTCHVSFDFLLRTRRGTEMTYPTAYTFCIVKRSKGAKLYNLTMN